jgi:Ribosomally synthesized peptide prototyped by Frankia Franean1_4349.
MSQRSVEQVIGRLATDEGFRQRFQMDREAALVETIANGLQLTPIEQRAILDLDVTACERFAGCLDPRIQKINLRRKVS